MIRMNRGDETGQQDHINTQSGIQGTVRWDILGEQQLNRELRNGLTPLIIQLPLRDGNWRYDLELTIKVIQIFCR